MLHQVGGNKICLCFDSGLPSAFSSLVLLLRTNFAVVAHKYSTETNLTFVATESRLMLSFLLSKTVDR